MTIAYANGEPLDLGNIITGYERPSNIRMHYKIYPLSEVSQTHELMLVTVLANTYSGFYLELISVNNVTESWFWFFNQKGKQTLTAEIQNN